MKKNRLQQRISITILVIFCILWILPVYLMIVASFKTQQEIAQALYLHLPKRFQIENYASAFGSISRGLINSAIIASITTGICVLIGSWGGFFLSKFKIRYGNTIFFLVAIASFLPYEVVLIPLTKLLHTMHLLNSYPGLIFTYTLFNAPLATLIAATFFQDTPDVLMEAATLDGCNPVQFYWRILVPISIPGLASIMIIIFSQVWNEFILGLTLTLGDSVRPVMPALDNLKGSLVAQWHIQMAGALVTCIPPLLVFVLLGKYFIAGLTTGAIKE